MSEKTITMNDIAELGRAAEKLLNGKEFFIGTIADRLNKAASVYPHDQAIRTMEALIDKRFKQEGSLSIISQREFQELYNQVSGLGKAEAFKEELGDLLYDASVEKVAYYNEDHIKGLRGDGSMFDLVDQNKVSELSGIFENPEDSLGKSAFVESGRKGVRLELLSMGFDNPAVEVSAQDNNFVIFAAEVDTVSGRTPFLVPAEIKLGSVLLPSVFVSGNEFVDFTCENILRHASVVKGQKTATPNAVLETLNKLSNKVSNVKTASLEDEGKDAVASTSLSSPGLYSELVEEPQAPDFSFAQVDMPKQLEGLSNDFIRETLTEAGLSYNRDVVLNAKSMLSQELNGMGLTHDKVVIASEWQKGIIFATNIIGRNGKKTIEVPVEIVNEKVVLMPHSFASGTVVKAFNEENLVAFAHSKEEGGFDAFFSDKQEMTFNELYNESLRSAAFGDFVTVEENLAIIESRFGSQFHKMAFEDLMDLMRIGFNSDEKKPLDAIDAYIKEATTKIKDKEKQEKLSNSLLYLYPGDDR